MRFQWTWQILIWRRLLKGGYISARRKRMGQGTWWTDKSFLRDSQETYMASLESSERKAKGSKARTVDSGQTAEDHERQKKKLHFSCEQRGTSHLCCSKIQIWLLVSVFRKISSGKKIWRWRDKFKFKKKRRREKSCIWFIIIIFFTSDKLTEKCLLCPGIKLLSIYCSVWNPADNKVFLKNATKS